MNIKRIRYLAALLTMILLASLAFFGCKDDKPSLPGVTSQKPAVKKTVISPDVQQLDAGLQVQDASEQEGYVYEQKGRRDPFTSLIIPTGEKGIEDSKIGTLEGYDLGEFALLAIAKKGKQYYALLVTPDNRSFTVDKGTTIGLSKGKVKEIASDKVVMEEYRSDYKGEKIPRQILLELRKGE